MKFAIHKYKSSSKFYLFTITLILILSHKFFYMWLQDDYIRGNLKYSDISVILSVIVTSMILVRYGSPKAKMRYFIYAFLGMTFVSTVTANFIYNQSLLRGLLAQRCQIAYLLLFLGVERLFERNKINKSDIERILFSLCWFELLLCTVQYFVYIRTGDLFLTVKVGVRYESGRLYFEPALLLMVVFKAYHELLTNKKRRVINLIFIVWVAFFLMEITKMRAITLAYIVCLVVGLVIWRGDMTKKVIVLVVGVITGIEVLSKCAIVQDLIKTLSNLNADANYNIRNLGRSQFLSEFAKTPITGRGYPSISSSAAYSALKGYLFVDNGIFGLIYSYGVLGVLWWIGLWASLLIKAWLVRKRQLSYILYLMYYTVGLMTDFSWFWTATCSFSIMMALLLEEERKMNMDSQS